MRDGTHFVLSCTRRRECSKHALKLVEERRIIEHNLLRKESKKHLFFVFETQQATLDLSASQDLKLLIRGLETSMTKLGGCIDELERNLFQR